MGRTRLVMLSWRGPTHPDRGGAEAYTEEVLARLAQIGDFDIFWYSSTHNAEMPQELHGIRLIYGARWPKVYISGHNWLRQHHREFDLVIDQINTFGFLSPIVTKRSIALIHQPALDVWDFEVRFPGNLFGKLAERAFLSAYKRTPFIAVSNDTIKSLRNLGWEGQSFLAPNGIRVSDTTYQKTKNPSIAFLGRFSAKAKRIEHAIDIFKRARQSHPSLELYLIGRGNIERQYSSIDGIKIYANVDNQTRDEVLGKAWCCLATSVREGYGRMVLEAAAVGTVTIAYNTPGLGEAVSDNFGILVPGDPIIASEVVSSLLSQPQKLFMLGQKAKENVSRLSWDLTLNNFLGAIELALTKN